MQYPKLDWTICVVSRLHEESTDSQLANALLYGEQVIWLPTILPYVNSFAIAEQALQKSDFPLSSGWLDRERQYHSDIIETISSANLPIHIPDRFRQDDADLFMQLLCKRLKFITENPASFKDLWGDTFDQFATITGAKALFHGTSEDLTMPMNKAQATIVESSGPFKIAAPSHWDPHDSAQLLMNALSSVLLPDVSSLPLLEVLELRRKVEDELDPMRAELLRLTEDMRKVVEAGCSEQDLAREAENLIKTRVEPVVREASARTREMLRSRWKRFLIGSAQVIGLAGAGFLSLDMAKDAVKKAVEVAAEFMSDGDKAKVPQATARFTLEVKRLSAQKV